MGRPSKLMPDGLSLWTVSDDGRRVCRVCEQIAARLPLKGVV